jgi:hypothetical protein
MVHATDKKLRRNEKPVPQPEPLVNLPNTQLAGCLFGVKTSRAMQMPTDARMLIGANHRTILCRDLVVKEQTMPQQIRRATAKRNICRADLGDL